MNAPGNISAPDTTRAGMLTYGYRSDVGRRREHNEDSCAALGRADLATRLDGLFVVADGMGGMGGGDVASSLVVQTVTQAVQDALLQRTSGRLDAGSVLLDALDRANAEVQARRAQRPELRRMGTTCVAALMEGNRLSLVNVGDSRAYLLRDGRLAQLTEDHSRVWEEMRAGRLTREEAQHSQFRNQILRGVGLAPNVDADLFSQTLRAGDTVLLCSDGLTVEVEEVEIARILAAAASPQEASDRLVEAALRQGGSDNITVIVLRYGPFTPLTSTEDEPTDPDARWREALRERESYEKQQAALPAPPRSRSMRPLLILLAVVALTEAVGLGWFWQQAHRPTPAPKPAPKLVRLTDSPLAYGDLRLIAKGPLRDDVLQITPDGNILVATAAGVLKLLTPQGAPGPPLINDMLPVTQPAAPARSGKSSSKSKGAPAATGPDVVLDASGNRYQLAPVRGIDKYDPTGIQVQSGIGKAGKKGLHAPTKIAVDTGGDIYVIDEHQLKRFDASPKPDPIPGS